MDRFLQKHLQFLNDKEYTNSNLFFVEFLLCVIVLIHIAIIIGVLIIRYYYVKCFVVELFIGVQIYYFLSLIPLKNAGSL